MLVLQRVSLVWLMLVLGFVLAFATSLINFPLPQLACDSLMHPWSRFMASLSSLQFSAGMCKIPLPRPVSRAAQALA